MDVILLVTALLILLAGGCGAVLLLLDTEAVNWLELLSLSFLMGAGLVSLLAFGAGTYLSLSGAPLRLTISAASLGLGAVGILRRWHTGPRLAGVLPSVTGAVLLLGTMLAFEVMLVIWSSLATQMTGDGLVIWDLKARLACLNGGVIPISYFSDPTRIWSHPEYPLLVPLSNAWFYGWLGQCNQWWGKLIFHIFDMAALGILYIGGLRLGNHPWQGFFTVLVGFFVPHTRFYLGGSASGYADFPLAVVYLASVIYFIEYWKTGADRALRLFGCLAAILPWVKQEGSILWLCLTGLAFIKAFDRKSLRSFVLWIVPGLIICTGWNLFIRLLTSSVGQDFLPFTWTTLLSNFYRWPDITEAVIREPLHWYLWGLLWPGLALALPMFVSKEVDRQPVVLFLTVTLPLTFYAGLYFFSDVTPFTAHILSSLSRLFLQVSFVAVLIVGLAIPVHSLSVFKKLLVSERI